MMILFFSCPLFDYSDFKCWSMSHKNYSVVFCFGRVCVRHFYYLRFGVCVFYYWPKLSVVKTCVVVFLFIVVATVVRLMVYAFVFIIFVHFSPFTVCCWRLEHVVEWSNEHTCVHKLYCRFIYDTRKSF